MALDSQSKYPSQRAYVLRVRSDAKTVRVIIARERTVSALLLFTIIHFRLAEDQSSGITLQVIGEQSQRSRRAGDFV